MLRQYREIEQGEFILIAGDCSQGGEDFNCTQFISKTKKDIPLVYHKQGVAATQTSDIHPVIEKIFDVTGIKPMVGLERNNGGASEMERLRVLNRDNKYDLFVMPDIGKIEEQDTKLLGFTTTSLTRPILVGDAKNIVDVNGLTIYDEETIKELFWFVVNKQGKPEAMKGKHDDTVMALAVGIQMYNHCQEPLPQIQVRTTARYNIQKRKSWGIS